LVVPTILLVKQIGHLVSLFLYIINSPIDAITCGKFIPCPSLPILWSIVNLHWLSCGKYHSASCCYYYYFLLQIFMVKLKCKCVTVLFYFKFGIRSKNNYFEKPHASYLRGMVRFWGKKTFLFFEKKRGEIKTLYS
jgi:hypothetical protein